MIARTVVIVVGATVLTTLGVHAFELGTASSAVGSVVSRVTSALGTIVGGSIVSSVSVAQSAMSGGCPQGMVSIVHEEDTICVDQFEASPNASCSHVEPASSLESELNLATPGCAAASVAEVVPWRYLSQAQAAEACERAGKQLISPEVWYAAAHGTQREGCSVDMSEAQRTGTLPACVSPQGVHDMVGNVWEWTSGLVVDGVYGGYALPEAGYVLQTGPYGFPRVTTPTQGELGAEERLWHDAAGERGIMRGGYYQSKTDAGVYALHAGSPPTFAGVAVGFRCMSQ